MSKNQQQLIPPGWAVSRASYKKLGTIVEHLVDCINPQLLCVTVLKGLQGITIIRVVPFSNYKGIVGPVWELEHHPYFNAKLVIEKDMLIPGAEW